MRVNKILFLHMPQNPFTDNSFIQVAPLGLVGLATYLRDTLNLDVVIMNAGSYLNSNYSESFVDYVCKQNFDLILLDLQWHQQLYDVLLTIDWLKGQCKYIAIGGITASIFGEELLRKNKGIDFLIKGDGEIPIKELVIQINGKQNYINVPNLIWRSNEDIIDNPLTFSADNLLLNNINDWDLSVYDKHAGYNGKIKKNQQAPNFFYVPIGRGCMEECSFCGGSKSSFKKCFNREKVVYRKYDVVANTIIKVHKKFKLTYFYICYDVKEIPEEWWLNLFSLIKQSGIKISLFFEAYRIPRKNFFEKFYDTFNTNTSQIILSPGCFSDEARNRYTSVRYDLKKLENFLEYVNNRVPVYIYFSLVPHIDEVAPQSIIKNVFWCRKILKKFWNVHIYVSPVVMEPNSPWERFSEEYGIKKYINNLDDFIDNSNLYTKENMFIGYQFKYYKLIAALYYGVTNDNSLIDFDSEMSLVIRSIDELNQKKEVLRQYKKIIINSNDNIEQYICFMLHMGVEVSTSESILFRTVNDLQHLNQNIDLFEYNQMHFWGSTAFYFSSLRNSINFLDTVGQKQTYENLIKYVKVFEILNIELKKMTIEPNDFVYFINQSKMGEMVPICIKKNLTGIIKYYIVSRNQYFFKEISSRDFICLCKALKKRRD